MLCSFGTDRKMLINVSPHRFGRSALGAQMLVSGKCRDLPKSLLAWLLVLFVVFGR